MRIRLIRKGEQKEGVWAGGTTTQLAIGPEGADYAARRFDWRISTARVERDESDFTPLPGIRRILMVLEGSVYLTHDGVREIDLAPFEQDVFEGAQRCARIIREVQQQASAFALREHFEIGAGLCFRESAEGRGRQVLERDVSPFVG